MITTSMPGGPGKIARESWFKGSNGKNFGLFLMGRKVPKILLFCGVTTSIVNESNHQNKSHIATKQCR